MKNKTVIFKSFQEFLDREDKNINGVSEEFAKAYPDFAKDNQSNTGGKLSILNETHGKVILPHNGTEGSE